MCIELSMSQIAKDIVLKSALIIQGPILSIGRTGESLHDARGGLGVDRIVKFDCSDNINQLIATYGNVFDIIVISTWETENLEKITISKNVHVLQNRDMLKKLSPNSNQIGFQGNNKYRHFYTIQNALRYIKSYNVDIVVKVRSDNFVDASLLLDCVKSDISKLWFPKTISFANYLEDFYIGGSVNNLRDLCDAMLSGRPLHKSDHLDIFYQYTKIKSSANLIKIFDFFPRKNKWTKEQLNLISYANIYLFKYFPISVWNNQVWRGSSLKEENRIPVNIYRNQKQNKLIVNQKSFFCFNLKDFIYFILGDLWGSRYISLFNWVQNMAVKVYSLFKFIKSK